MAGTSQNVAKDYMVAFDNLKKHADETRATVVNWQSYAQGQIISAEDYQFISKFDQASPKLKADMLRESGAEFAKSILNLLRHIPKDNNLRYILTMVDDLLEEDPSRVDLFVQHSRRNKATVLSCFLSMLLRPDQVIAHQAAHILAMMCVAGVEHVAEDDVDYLLNWLIKQLNQPDNEYLQNVAKCLMHMFRVDYYRIKFVQIQNALTTVISVLNKKIGFQLQYQLICCLWLLSFNPAIVQDTFIEYNPIPVLAAILADALKDKVIRIILAFFRNLIEICEDKDAVSQYLLSMVQCKVPRTVDLLSHKDFEDPELKEDLESIQKRVEEIVQEISSFDEYKQEVKSHHLEWSPVHKSDKFWRENAARLNENNFELLRILASLLTNESEPIVLAVATHDIGEYVRCYPRGRKVLEQLECKTRVMTLMQHENSTVRYNALLATQKIMVDNWEYIGKPITK